MQLNKEAIAIIKEYRESGFTIAEITEHLRDLGFKQKMGGELCNATVSHFMIDNGMRTYHRKRIAKTTKKKEAAELKGADSNATLDLISSVASNTGLSKDQKMKVIQALL